MHFDLSDLDRLTGFADALERLFWCLMVVGFFTAILGSPGTGLEDFVRSRQGREEPVAPKKTVAPKEVVITKSKPSPEPEFTVYRTSRRPRRKKSAV
jgi:hypothetical protein